MINSIDPTDPQDTMTDFNDMMNDQIDGQEADSDITDSDDGEDTN